MIAALVMMAMCAGLYVTPFNVEYQVKAPEGEKGQYVACSNVIDALCMVFSALLAAVMIGVVGIDRELMFALVGLTGFVAAFVVYRYAKRIEG